MKDRLTKAGEKAGKAVTQQFQVWITQGTNFGAYFFAFSAPTHLEVWPHGCSRSPAGDSVETRG